jgi:hypothetical protein
MKHVTWLQKAALMKPANTSHSQGRELAVSIVRQSFMGPDIWLHCTALLCVHVTRWTGWQHESRMLGLDSLQMCSQLCRCADHPERVQKGLPVVPCRTEVMGCIIGGHLYMYRYVPCYTEVDGVSHAVTFTTMLSSCTAHV